MSDNEERNPAALAAKTPREKAKLLDELIKLRNDAGNEMIDRWKAEQARAESAIRERDEARAKLFPYADATEISGMSWGGFYLIGDKKSIAELRRIEHRSAQLDDYRKGFDERIAAEKERADAAREALRDCLPFSKAEIQSRYDRVRFAEGLIEQLPQSHDGASTWLLNYGQGERAQALRKKRDIGFDPITRSAQTVSARSALSGEKGK